MNEKRLQEISDYFYMYKYIVSENRFNMEQELIGMVERLWKENEQIKDENAILKVNVDRRTHNDRTRIYEIGYVSPAKAERSRG